MAKVSSVIDTILAEAGGKTRAERYRDMKAIASVIANRARQLGVSMEDVVSVQSEFNAYGKAFPPGVESYRALAGQALQDVVEQGPVNDATFYATPTASHRLPDGLEPVDETAGHQYFSDPQNRSIRTAQGFERPSEGMLASYAPEERTAAGASAFDGLFGGYEAQPQQGFSARGLLSDEAVRQPTGGLLSTPREGYGSPFGALGDRITSGFGLRTGPQTPLGIGSSNHKGVDLSIGGGVQGYPAEAAAGGVVSFAGPSRGYGNMVEISHPDGMRTRYGHLAEVGDLAIGDEIARGTPVGTVGNTGRSRGPHLHFETIDPNGDPVDPRDVIGFNSEVRVPTPAERPQDWQDATPMAVDRRDLPSLDSGLLSQQKKEYGVLADTMRQTPSLNLSGAGVGIGATGRMMDNAEVAQGSSALRDAMFGATPVGRATPDEMGSLQAEANRARQEMEMRMGSTFSLSPEQQQAALARRENSLGILGAMNQPASVANVSQPDTFGAQPMTAEFDPASYPANIKAAERLTGLAPNITSTTPVSGTQIDMPDISAPLSMSEFSGLQTNPALASALKTGVQPIGVQSVDVGLLGAPVGNPVTIEGPAVAEEVSISPQTSKASSAKGKARTKAAAGLLAQAEAEQAKAARGKQMKDSLKRGLGLLGGGALGGLLAGPGGALLGGLLANHLMRPPQMSVAATDLFPRAPTFTGDRGEGRSWGDRGSWNDSMRDAYRDSGQVRDAVDRGYNGEGLW